MASRRLAKSGIDWVKFAERVPAEQKPFFQAFKAKSDTYLRKAFSLPENLPVINWNYYKSRGLPGTFVEQFEKQYSSVKVPYPKENVTPMIDAQEKEAEKQVASFIVESKKRIEKHKKELESWENILPFEYMTYDDYKDAFPEIAFDPLNNPTAWPHNYENLSGNKEDDTASVKAAH